MKKLKRIVPLTLILFAFWVLITAKATLASLLAGLLVCLLLAVFANVLLPPQYDSQLTAGFIARVPVFFVLLLWEIIKANWDVWKRVMPRRLRISPQVVVFDSVLESDLARTILAGSINLTPGTITLDIDRSRFTVHCLALDHGEDLLDKRLERMVAWLFREGPAESRGLR